MKVKLDYDRYLSALLINDHNLKKGHYFAFYQAKVDV